MMQINVKMMSEEAYKTLQKNSKEVAEMIKSHPSDCSWLKEYLGFEPFEEKKYVIEDIQLTNDENYSNVAFVNAKTLYETLNKLPRYVLCNNRFWAWVTFEKAYRQAINSSKTITNDSVKNLWLQGNSRRDLMLGIISRYYFCVEITIEPKTSDKYELTKYALTNAEAYRNLAYRNIGMLKQVSLEYFRVQNDYSKKKGVPIGKKVCRELMKEVSRTGSVMLVDLCDNEEIYNRLYQKLEEIIHEDNDAENGGFNEKDL